MIKKKFRVVVLMGGKSPEHEVSIISGNEVVRQLDKSKYKAIPFVIPKSGKGIEKILMLKPDLVFIAMHGPFGEDGRVQGMLDLFGIRYTGPGVLASSIGMDKIMFRKVMLAENLPIPKFTTFSKGGNIKDISAKLGKLPYFVKPYNQGSSVGASVVKKESDLKPALDLALKYSDTALVDEYIDGTELTCAVIGNNNPIALPIVEIHALKGSFFDYKSKYTDQGAEEIAPARISTKLASRVKEMALKVYKALGSSGFSRVDFILKDNTVPVILETNTIPGLTPASLFPKAAMAAGISYSELLTTVIELALNKQ